ncbi:MAG: FAD-dependent protein [Bacillota bacterium]
MALLLSDIKMPVEAQWGELPALIAAQFSLPAQSVLAARIVRESLDARRKNDIHFRVSAVVQLEPVWQNRLLKRKDARVAVYEAAPEYGLPVGNEQPRGRIVVVGLGPAGLFAAYFLAQAGYKPLVVERGREVAQRRADVQRFWNGGPLDEQSNVMFGEGGAGAFSDGKLTARSKDPRTQVVLDTLAKHGAPGDIVYQAKPHIGTDLLQGVVQNMREAICRMGGEVRFEARMSDLHLQDGALVSVDIMEQGKKERIPCAACVLASGQAARDVYELLLEKGLTLIPKSFAVGVRIEHPQGMIDRAQYGALAGYPRLGAAEYRLTAKSGPRGVYTFCMCPGGHVVAASSQEGEVVVNGMSDRARNGKNANSAIIVQVGPEDFGYGPLDGVRFQRELERAAYLAGASNGVYCAPAQRLEDFLAGRESKSFGDVKPTYRPGVTMHRLDTLLPDFVANGIRDGIAGFSRQLHGFDLPDAVMTAVESRTSSPVRILRDERGEAAGAPGLFPVGEGAGYAGGIVSAAVDGMRAAERIAARYKPQP